MKQSNTIHIKIVSLFLLIVGLGLTMKAQPDFMLKLEEEIVNEGGVDHLHVKVSMAGSAAFNLGSCNLQFNFDTDVSLDPSPLQSYSLNNFYFAPTVTEPASNKASLNIVLFGPGLGGVNIVESSSGWTDLATIRFDINDPSGFADLSWSYTGGTTETVVFLDDEATQIFVGNPATDLVGVVGSPLPIEMKHIRADWASKKEQTGVISWETAAEYNTDYFIIERSEDLENWHSVGTTTAAGNSTSPIKYTFEDKRTSEVQGTSLYYRIQTIDIDKSESYSQIVVLERSQSLFSTQVFPTVFQNELTIAVQNNEKNMDSIEAVLMNMNGQVVHQEEYNGSSNFTIQNLSYLESGNYFLQIKWGTETQTQKLIKQ